MIEVNRKNCCIVCGIVAFILLETMLLTGFNCHSDVMEDVIDLKNTTVCTRSVHIGRRLFLHECSKDNRPVYDIRYFWKDVDDNVLKPSVIGVQMPTEEFNTVCNSIVTKG